VANGPDEVGGVQVATGFSGRNEDAHVALTRFLAWCRNDRWTLELGGPWALPRVVKCPRLRGVEGLAR
jgi:hypothetical protein